MGLGAVGESRGVAFPVLVHFVTRGKGRATIAGGMGKACREAVQLALVWADRNLDAASRWLMPRTPENEDDVLRVFEPDLDVLVALPPVLQLRKNGTSIGAAVAAAAVLAALQPAGLRARGRVAVSGEVSLRGALLPVAGIKKKMEAAHAAGCSVLVLPAANRADVAAAVTQWREGVPELVEWAGSSVVLAEDMGQVLQAITEDGTCASPPPPRAWLPLRRPDRAGCCWRSCCCCLWWLMMLLLADWLAGGGGWSACQAWPAGRPRRLAAWSPSAWRARPW